MFRHFRQLGYRKPCPSCSSEDKWPNAVYPLLQNRLCHSLTRKAKLVRWGILGFASAPLWGAYAYNRGFRLPIEGCLLRHLTGIPCPTCGMTRSFMAIARGDLDQALSYHLFGPVLFFLLLVATLHVLCELVTSRRIETVYSRALLSPRVQFLLIGSFLGYYGIRLQGLLRSGDLATSPLLSALNHLWPTMQFG